MFYKNLLKINNKSKCEMKNYKTPGKITEEKLYMTFSVAMTKNTTEKAQPIKEKLVS